MKKLSGYFHIVLNLHKMTLAEEVSFALGLKLTGDPDATSPPSTQPQVQTLANTVQTNLGAWLTDPAPKLSAKQRQDVDALSRALVADKNYVEQIANAKAKGDRAAFDEIAHRIGFVTKRVARTHQRVFESLPAERGAFHVRVPAEGARGITYVYRYGITTAVGTPPASYQSDISLSVTEVIVTGLPSGSIVAVEYAAVQHTPHAGSPRTRAANGPARSKVATAPPLNKAGRVTLVHGVSFLHFSDPIYIVVK